MTRNGRRYLEGIIEEQAETIRQKENQIIGLLAKVASLETKILAHSCTPVKMFQQFFNLPYKF